MPLEPRVARIVAVANRLDRRSGEDLLPARRTVAAATSARLGALVMSKGPEPAGQTDIEIPVIGGRIRIRLYRPHGTGPHPLYLFIHGGGWCAGTVEERDPRCRAVSAGADCLVASVDYRLAPENQYPTPLNDCDAALAWLVQHSPELGIDPRRLALGGESAGANLAAVLARRNRDRGGPPICHQWLDVPALDLTLASESIRSVPDGHLLDRADIDRYLDGYLPSRDQALEADASPLLVQDLAGLPPAWIMSAEFDKLRDDGLRYAAALEGAGVPVTHRLLAGHVHSSFAFTRILPSAAAYERKAIAALRAAFTNPDPARSWADPDG